MAVIVITLTIGLLVNRRPPKALYEQLSPRSSESDTPVLQAQTSEYSSMHGMRVPDNRRFRYHFLSVLLDKFPFALEIWYWTLTYWPYQLLRAASALHIDANPQRKANATATAQLHASQVLYFEQKVGIGIELVFQRLILRWNSLVMILLSDVYLLRLCLGVAFLAYGFTYFPRARYEAIRRTIALDNIIAFFLFSLWPCAPPRLMPKSDGFLDVLHPPPHMAGEASYWADNHFQLTLAAMPSLDFGTSLLLGMSIAVWGRHTWLRILGLLYPAAMLVAVVVTANDWLLDCVAGACVIAAGLYFNRILLRLRPLEEWLFYLCRAERPRDRLAVDSEDIMLN